MAFNAILLGSTNTHKPNGDSQFLKTLRDLQTFSINDKS